MPMDEISVSDMSPEAVLQEIFHSITQEIIDEVNIPREALSEPQILDVIRNMSSAGRPSVQFYVRWVQEDIILASYHR